MEMNERGLKRDGSLKVQGKCRGSQTLKDGNKTVERVRDHFQGEAAEAGCQRVWESLIPPVAKWSPEEGWLPQGGPVLCQVSPRP